ncbi:hypothetical protein H0H92_011637 [Tricholoma furcatifolium]|nr:hypothetical protein H0H92_011637 [Tricholoma furcatifolium]
MPKRGAEKELNKDNAEIHEENEDPGTGFLRANDEELSKRRIVGLPRRAQSAAKLTPPTPQPFSAFATSSATPSPSSGIFGNPVAATATSTAKTFASFLGPSPSTTGPVASQPSQTSTPPVLPAASPAQDDAYLIKYYTSLRGLNLSLLDALNKATEDDPFVDITNVLERYKTLRLDVQTEFDEKSQKWNPPTSTSVKPVSIAKPPAPPAGGFAGFGSSGTSSSNSTSSIGASTGGFQPKPTSSTTTTSGFSFSIPPASTTTSANLFTFPSSSSSSTLVKSDSDTTKNTSTSSPFTFGSSSTPDDKAKNTSSRLFSWGPQPAMDDKKKDAPAPSYLFGSPAPSNEEGKNTPSNPFVLTSSSASSDKEKSASSPFTFGSSKPNDKEKSASPFIFGSSPASGKEKSASPFTFGSSTPSEKPLASSSFSSTSQPTSSPFTFGKSDSSVTATSPFGASSGSSVFGTTFPGSGSSESSKVSSFGGFGKPAGSAGSIGNPVGFSFAAPTKVSEGNDDTPDKKENDEGTPGSQTDGAETEGSVGLITTNPHDEEGAGEEEEDTVHDTRSKILRLDKKEGGSSWTDLGVGILRIKKHKETGARRILLRNSGTGKIILNFRLYSELKPTQNKKSLQFIGHDEKGASQIYTARMPDEEKATALREALEKEIALL